MTRHGERQGTIQDIHDVIPGLNDVLLTSSEGLPIAHGQVFG
jgi:hypothetical protein